MSKLRWDEPGDDEYIERYDLATHLGFAIGAAILIRQQYEIALNLMTMGEHHVKGEVEYGSIRDALDMDQKVALITLTIGYILNGS